jgi:hypothetical protein
MTLLDTNLLTEVIYIAVISQILSISIIFANSWYKRKSFLLTKYPPVDYPNLYAQSSVVEFNRIKIRKLIDRTIVILSLSAVLFFYLTQTAIEIVATSILVIAAIQLLPWLLSNYWYKKDNLLMVKNRQLTKRKGCFINRKTTDFVTPNKLGLIILSYGATLIFSLYIFIEKLWFEDSNKALLLVLLNTLMVIYLAWLLFNSLYGKKKDHFISSEDRLKLIADKCKTLTSFCIMYSAFILGIFIIRTFDFNQLFIFAMTGFFIQLIFALSFTKRVEKNYEVYK